jgi:hypothetical protein
VCLPSDLRLFTFSDTIDVVYTGEQSLKACEDLRERLRKNGTIVVHTIERTFRTSARMRVAAKQASLPPSYSFVPTTKSATCLFCMLGMTATPRFGDFMGDANIRKASIGAKTDDSFVQSDAQCRLRPLPPEL